MGSGKVGIGFVGLAVLAGTALGDERTPQPAWSELSPPCRTGVSVIFDSRLKSLILFGGAGALRPGPGTWGTLAAWLTFIGGSRLWGEPVWIA